jgi:hypothetical protein
MLDDIGKVAGVEGVAIIHAPAVRYDGGLS